MAAPNPYQGWQDFIELAIEHFAQGNFEAATAAAAIAEAMATMRVASKVAN